MIIKRIHFFTCVNHNHNTNYQHNGKEIRANEFLNDVNINFFQKVHFINSLLANPTTTLAFGYDIFR